MAASDKSTAGDSVTRRMLLDATMQIMLEEGYAGATSRRVAARAGVKPALVHYYFPNMDELYLAVFREGAQVNLDRQQEALASDQPLHALWDEASEPSGARLLMEFMALANHRKAIRSEIALWAERWRDAQITALDTILREHGAAGDWRTPAVVSVLMACVGRMLVLEDALDISTGHGELRTLISQTIDDVERPI
ncbi:TetR/AcrR family transcriptional regulator [Mycolicibacterium arenosum]|uniref:TetR/AcrR family transcriptional regulator n=1 Tax=Mycolicibacterium arenosum TaxID=2952157 RepID=A0ABT1M9P7_9MYCO|nr:TetR/AcrR family transcriptional regulator [Mycolicibacterium sp. CAU 1645]MCP9275899.1 TetR/AcrR family transcriptional regulator [Mycolicibacterium sp. CAU 1645]